MATKKISARFAHLTCTAAIFLAISAQAGFADDDDKSDKKIAPVPKNVAGSYLSGEFARTSGHMDQAVRYATRVHHEQPDNMAVAVQLEGMLLLAGKVPEAVTLAGEIKTIAKKNDNKDASKDPLSDLILTVDAMKRGQPDAAAEVLKAAIASGNTQLWVPLIRGWVNIAQNKFDKPLTVSASSSMGGQAAPLMHYHLALIHSQAGFKEAAAKDFKEAVADPKTVSSRVMGQLITFYNQNGEPKILTPIVKAYQEAHPDATSADITPIVTANDGIAELLYSMGGLMYSAGGLNDAAIYLQLSLAIRPDFPEASMALGDAYAELQNPELSAEAYGKIAETSKYYNRAQLRLAINIDHNGKEKEALALMDALAAKTPESPDALVTKGDLLRMHQHFADAIVAYTDALKRVPKLKASDWAILFARGACFERIGKWPDAERDLQQALDLSPDQPDVLNYLGYGWLEQGQHITQAQAMIAKAVKMRPEDPQIVDSMGWALYLTGDYKQATTYLEKAIELLPADPTVNDHLGDVYWRDGRKRDARFQWERSLTYAPDEKLADTIRKKLKDGLPPMPTLADKEAPAASPNKTATP